MMKPYRTIEDVLRSPWAATERPRERAVTDRVLRSTKLEDSIYADLRDGDDGLEQAEGEAAKKLPSFPALSRDVFQSFLPGPVPGCVSVLLFSASAKK